MTDTSKTPRTGANPAIDGTPITELEPPRSAPTGGRPRKLPPMPLMPMEDAERKLFDAFIDEYLAEYSDISNADYRILYLAAVEYIKYLRIAAYELKSGRVISMARQHPAVNMRALLDQLSATRKQRVRGKPTEPEEAQELRALLLQLSKG